MGSTQDQVVVTVVPTRADVTAVLTAWPWQHVRRLRTAVLLVGALVVASQADLLVISLSGSRMPGAGSWMAGVLVVLSVAVAAFTLGSPWFPGRSTMRRAGAGGPVTWTFDAAGLRLGPANDQWQVPWSQVSHLVRTDRVVAFALRPDRHAIGLRADALDDAQLERVRGWWLAPAASSSEPGARSPRDEAWGGPAWADEIVVREVLTVAFVRRTSIAAAPRWQVRVAAVALVVVLAVVLPVEVLDLVAPSPGRTARTQPSGCILLVSLAGAALLLEISVRGRMRWLATAPSLFRATPESLTMQTPLGRATVPWSRVESARERGGLLVVRTGRPRAPLGMPTATLSAEQRARLRAWILRGTDGRVTLPEADAPGGRG